MRNLHALTEKSITIPYTVPCGSKINKCRYIVAKKTKKKQTLIHSADSDSSESCYRIHIFTLFDV